MKPIQLCIMIWGTVLMHHGAAQTSVTGVIVDANGKPIPKARCCVSGFPQPSGGYVNYSGLQRFFYTDREGRFSIPLPRGDPLVDLQFEGAEHAPLFLYKIRPVDSPLRVVMSEGKILRGRIIEREKGKSVPVPHATIELEMAQEGYSYHNRQMSDSNGEFRFRISQPPNEWPWMLFIAGKRLPVNYEEVTPVTVMIIEVSIKMTPTVEPIE